MPAQVQPLDPNTDKGREVAARINQVLAEIFVELDAKKVVAEREQQTQEAA